MLNEIWKTHTESGSKNLDIGKTNSVTLDDLTSNDGSEDPGSELNTVIKAPKDKDSKHPQPQSDEVLNPGLNSENDI